MVRRPGYTAVYLRIEPGHADDCGNKLRPSQSRLASNANFLIKRRWGASVSGDKLSVMSQMEVQGAFQEGSMFHVACKRELMPNFLVIGDENGQWMTLFL